MLQLKARDANLSARDTLLSFRRLVPQPPDPFRLPANCPVFAKRPGFFVR